MAIPDGIQIRPPDNDIEFEQYYALRWEVLRKPLGKPKGSERDESDDRAFHLIAVAAGKQILAGGRMHMNSSDEAQIRFMFVTKTLQRKGIGQALLIKLEEAAAEMGAGSMILQARDYAIDFYLRCGYEIVEKSYILYNVLQHYKMRKTLSSNS